MSPQRLTTVIAPPLGHMTGFAAGMLLGLKIGATVIFQDVWEPKRGIGIMANEGVTYSAGAATFLADMCEAVAGGAAKPPAEIGSRAWNPYPRQRRGRCSSAGWASRTATPPASCTAAW